MALASLGLLGSPLAHFLSGQGGGLPRPADLFQQAQALQLLAHLQTVLQQQQPLAAGPGHPGGQGHQHHPAYPGNAVGQPNLFTHDMQKVNKNPFSC